VNIKYLEAGLVY